jgi:4-alpha-glucanotransferase
MREYTKSDGREPQWELIRLGMLSVADQAIFPLQDFMGLNTDHRMNLPGTVGDNWLWRYTNDMLSSVDEGRIKLLTEMSNRKPKQSNEK